MKFFRHINLTEDISDLNSYKSPENTKFLDE